MKYQRNCLVTRENEDVMERLISLFREPDYEQWSPGQAQPPPQENDEPLYFRQLLEYLRQQREDEKKEQADVLIGA
jgi:hypothetical protein